MLVIGEKINATIKSVGTAIANRDAEFISRLAREQAEAGADFIDVNAGEGSASDTSAIEWLVDIVQNATDKPLAIDSDVPEVIAAGLQRYRGEKVMVNSITAETRRLEAVSRLAKERDASLLALAMGKEGIPVTAEKRLEACETIMDYLAGLGFPDEKVYFDPLVLPVGVGENQGIVTIKTIQQIKKRFPRAKTAMGLSNVSYGLPGRRLINRSFLLMAIGAGLDAALLDPLDSKMMSAVIVARLVMGEDPHCRRYMRAYRQGSISE